MLSEATNQSQRIQELLDRANEDHKSELSSLNTQHEKTITQLKTDLEELVSVTPLYKCTDLKFYTVLWYCNLHYAFDSGCYGLDFQTGFCFNCFKRHYVGFLQQAKKSSLEEDNTKQIEKLNGDLANLKFTLDEQKAELQASQKEKENLDEQLKSVNFSLESANAKVFICMHYMEVVFYTNQMRGTPGFLTLLSFFGTE